MRAKRMLLAVALLLAPVAVGAQPEVDLHVSKSGSQPGLVQLTWSEASPLSTYEVWCHNCAKDITEKGTRIATTGLLQHQDDRHPEFAFYQVYAHCDDDGWEENDTAEEAFVLAWDLESEPLVLCSGDEDWFAGQGHAGTTAWAEVVYNETIGEPALELYDLAHPDQPVARGTKVFPGVLHIQYAFSQESDFAFRVYSPQGNELPYFGTFHFPPEACEPDVWEPDDTPDQAKPGHPAAGHYEGSLCAGDQDWIVNWLPTGSRFLVWLQVPTTPHAGQMGIELLDSDGVTVLLRCHMADPDCSDGTSILMTHNVMASGNYYIRLYDPLGRETNEYWLDMLVD
jgi:hypothetical protein